LQPKVSKTGAKSYVNELGIVDDGYDYTQHLRHTDSNRIYSRSGGFLKKEDDLFGKLTRQADEGMEEVDRQLEAITLTNEGMDGDIRHQLFDDDVEFGEGDELLDDFCEVADMQVLEMDELKERGYIVEGDRGQDNIKYKVEDVVEFDYEAHIRALIEKSELARGNGKVDIKEGGDFFAGFKPRGMEDDDDESGEFADDDSGVFEDDTDAFGPPPGVGITSPPPPSGTVGTEEDGDIAAVTEAYLLALGEYDDEEIGALEYNAGGGGGEWIEEGGISSEDEVGEDEDDGAPRGEFDNVLPTAPVPVVEDGVALLRDVENDTYVTSLLDEYIQDKKDELFMVGTGMRRGGGSGFTALVDGKLRLAEELDDAIEGAAVDCAKIDINEELQEADDILRRPKERPPEEDVRIDGMSYFDEKVRNPWDVESVLSTYSNLDNRPKEIGSGRRRKKGKELVRQGLEGVVEEGGEEYQKIELSAKTGLPVNMSPYPNAHEEEDEEEEEFERGVNKGEGRKKGESKEEKRTRKQRVKEEREERRREKQENKGRYGDEIAKRSKGKDQVLGGRAVFKYS